VTLDARLSVLCDCYEIIKQNYERSAHPFDDGSCSLIYRSLERTAAGL